MGLTMCAVVASGCGVSYLDGAGHEAEPQAFESSLEQGLVTCNYRQDTGYSGGSPFAITVVSADGKPAEVATANAYAVMQAAAAQAGVNLVVVSGFRTMSEQQYLYSCYVNCNCNSCNLAAKPGTSNHQSGHALDLNTSSAGVYNWLSANGARFGFKRTVPSEIWHWEWWGGGPGGGPCGGSSTTITDDNCTSVEAENCGKFGCGCVDHACNGGACPGSGCSAQHTKNCGAFGCGCADGKCSGGYCPGTGCSALEDANCGKVGCACVDHLCGGGYCPGAGCTAREMTDCGMFGCGCTDHKCAGGFCEGNGCTAKETTDCSKVSCGCVDHKCSGGMCEGSGSTAKLTKDCAGFGCGSVDAQCSGAFCPGTGCTAKQTNDCSAKGCGCVDQKCSGGMCTGTGCTERQKLDCEKTGATCSMGVCRKPGTDAGFVVDAGRPPVVDAGFLADGGIEEPSEPIREPNPNLPDGGLAPNPFYEFPDGDFLAPVTGGCASVPAPVLLSTALLLALRRRRTSRR